MKYKHLRRKSIGGEHYVQQIADRVQITTIRRRIVYIRVIQPTHVLQTRSEENKLMLFK